MTEVTLTEEFSDLVDAALLRRKAAEPDWDSVSRIVGGMSASELGWARKRVYFGGTSLFFPDRQARLYRMVMQAQEGR